MSKGKLRSMRVSGTADPQLLIRVLNVFAQRGLIPDEVKSSLLDDRLTVDIASFAFDADQWERIAERLSALPTATSVSIQSYSE